MVRMEIYQTLTRCLNFCCAKVSKGGQVTFSWNFIFGSFLVHFWCIFREISFLVRLKLFEWAFLMRMQSIQTDQNDIFEVNRKRDFTSFKHFNAPKIKTSGNHTDHSRRLGESYEFIDSLFGKSVFEWKIEKKDYWVLSLPLPVVILKFSIFHLNTLSK